MIYWKSFPSIRLANKSSLNLVDPNDTNNLHSWIETAKISSTIAYNELYSLLNPNSLKKLMFCNENKNGMLVGLETISCNNKRTSGYLIAISPHNESANILFIFSDQTSCPNISTGKDILYATLAIDKYFYQCSIRQVSAYISSGLSSIGSMLEKVNFKYIGELPNYLLCEDLISRKTITVSNMLYYKVYKEEI